MKNLLLIADYRGWAWDIKSRNILKHIKPYGFDVTIEYYYDYFKDIATEWHDLGYQENKSIDFSSHDAIIFFSIKFARAFDGRFDHTKTYVGICSHMYYNGSSSNPEDVAFLNKFKGVFVLNRFLFKDFYPVIKNLYYCPNGVDTQLFQPKSKVGSGKLLTVGWVGNPNHGCDKGFFEYIYPLSKRGFKLRVSNKETLNRYEDMPDYYNQIDVYVCTSNTEGTPNPCLEAAACGRPILSTKVGNMPEFVGDGWNGFLVERSINDFVNKLEILSRNRDILNQMSLNARKKAITWDWNNQIIHFVNMLSSLSEKS